MELVLGAYLTSARLGVLDAMPLACQAAATAGVLGVAYSMPLADLGRTANRLAMAWIRNPRP